MNNINICLACDENYAFLARVAMTSVMRNNSSVCFFLLDNGLTRKSKDEMMKLCNEYHAEIVFLNCDKIVTNLKEMGFNPQGPYKSYSAYLRLFLVEFLPDTVDKILYIDCDVTCENSLNELFAMDLEAHTLAGISDVLPSLHNEYIGFKSSEAYYNSGVLLIDVKAWKEKKYSKKIIDLLHSGRTQYPYHDQDLINIVFRNDIYRLKPKYMTMYPAYTWGRENIKKYLEVEMLYTAQEYAEAVKNPVLIHHLDNIEGRPWEKSVVSDSKGAEYWNKSATIAFPDGELPKWNKKISLKGKILRCFYHTFPKLYFIYMKKNRHESVKKRCESYQGE
ncbi:MAG: glycosyltransferase family 8 protein [Anaerostipes sp.]|nr:glycosyltransferase family 8 protein [Anaerostipes sp.]